MINEVDHRILFDTLTQDQMERLRKVREEKRIRSFEDVLREEETRTAKN